MTGIFQNPTSVESDLPEPYGSILGWLGDFWEQAEMMRTAYRGDEFCQAACDLVQNNIAAVSAVVQAVGEKEKAPGTRRTGGQ